MKTIPEIHRANLQIIATELGGVGEAANKIGCSSSQFSQWMNGSENSGTGKPRGMRNSSTRRIEIACNKPVGWMDKSHDEDHFPSNVMRVISVDSSDSEFIQVPMVELRLSCGVTGFQTEPDRRDGGTLGVRRSWVERGKYMPEKLVAIRVKGESMEPALFDGDVVIINTAETHPIDGVVFAVNYEGEAVVKRFSRDAGEWWLMSDNPDQRKYHRKICRGDACLIVGRVVRKESDKI